MANKQINELTELTTASGTDLLLVYDLNEAGSEKTKKITVNNLMTPYETGTWTPVLSDASSGGNTASMSLSGAIYSKIGNQVMVEAGMYNISTAGMTGGNELFIQGLPFTDQLSTLGSVMLNNITFSGYAVSYISANVNYARVFQVSSGNSWSTIKVSALTSGTAAIYINMTYITNE